MLDLRIFMSGNRIPSYSRDSHLGERLETIRPTNLGLGVWVWIKNLLKGAFDVVSDRLINLSIYEGVQLGQLGYNAQYPYLQKALRRYIGDSTIVVYDGTMPDAVIVMPSQEENTIIINEGTIVYPVGAYILAPFVIHSDNALSKETRSRIGAEVDRLKFAGTRFVIDAPYPTDRI